MPDDLADHGVSEITLLIRIGDRRDPVKKIKSFMVVGYQFVDNIGLGAMLGHVSLLDLAWDGYQGNALPPSARSLGPGSTNQVALHQPAGTP